MKRIAFAFAALTLILAGLPQLAVHPVFAQSGSTYTNPAGQYSVTWDPAAWFVVSQDDPADGTDLVLSNGISFVSFTVDDTIPTPPFCVTALEAGFSQVEGITNLQPLNDAEGNPIRSVDADRSFVAFTFTADIEGQSIDMARYFECRTVVPFQSVLLIDHIVVPPEAYPSEAQLVETLLAGLTINGNTTNQQDTTPTPEPTATEPVATEEAAPTVEGTEPSSNATAGPGASAQTGQVGPVMVSDAWRLSVVAAVRSAGLNAIDLQRRDGKEWVVVVADLTNWTNDAASIIPRDIRLASSVGNPLRAAPSSSGTAAEALGVNLTNVSDEVSFRANQTRRVVLAYSVDENATDLAISFGTTLPLDDLLAQDVDLDDLPSVVRPPRLVEADVDRVLDGDTLEVFLPDEDQNLTVNLLNVLAPVDSDCFADEAADQLSDLAGSTVFLEAAGDDVSPDEVSRYVWVEGDDGTRTQLNRELIAGGFAVFKEESATRFATWLEEGGREASDAGIEIWEECADDLPTATEEPTATPEPTETPVPTETREPTATLAPTTTPVPTQAPSPTEAASPTSTSEAGAIEIKLLDIRYDPTELTIPADTDVTITLANDGAAPHTFNIDELDIHSGEIAPGDSTTVTINAAAGEYEYYCSVPGHKEAGMVGTLTVVPGDAEATTTPATTGSSDEPTSAMFRGGPSHQGIQPGPGLAAPAKLPWEFQTTSAIFSSPAIVDGVIYVGSLDGSMYALGSNSGPAHWQFTTGAGILSSPAVADGIVYFGSEDTNLYAVDAATGREVWRFATSAEVSSSPAVVDGVVYVGGMDTYVYAVDAKTGDEIWKVRIGPAFSSPAVVDGVVYIGAAQSVFALNAATGEEVWTVPTGGPIESSPAVVGDTVYIANDVGFVLAVNRETGEERWRFQAGDAVISSVAVAEGKVFFGSNDQNVYAVDAETGQQVWIYATGDQVLSSPAVADGVVFVGSFDGFIYGLDAETGAERWRYQGGPMFGSPSVVDGVVYFGSADGRLLARQPFNLLNLGG